MQSKWDLLLHQWSVSLRLLTLVLAASESASRPEDAPCQMVELQVTGRQFAAAAYGSSSSTWRSRQQQYSCLWPADLMVCCGVCRQHLEEAEVKAVKDQAEAMNRFRSWASQRVPGAVYMNVGSGAQIRQLLFAGVQNQRPEKGTLETERVFKVRQMT